jgi:DNA-binding MarR family transcriptional regulator
MATARYDRLKLENQICFPLYASSKEVIHRYKDYLTEIGLTYTQYIAMMVLWERAPLSVKGLGEFLYLDSGTLTPLLKKLEKSGLILRERDPQDERSVTISLTEAGRGLREKAIQIPEKMESCIPLTNEEAQTLYKLLYKILKTV